MKRSLAILGLAIVLGWSSPPVAAKTISVSQKIYVRAVVAPARTIIVDGNDKITEIDSNTSQDVVPVAYLGDVGSGIERPLTADIYSQYHRLLPLNPAAGVLYKAPLAGLTPAQAGPRPASQPLSIARITSI